MAIIFAVWLNQIMPRSNKKTSYVQWGSYALPDWRSLVSLINVNSG